MPVASQDDLDAVIAARFHAQRVEALRPLITPELVEEHRRARIPRWRGSSTASRLMRRSAISAWSEQGHQGRRSGGAVFTASSIAWAGALSYVSRITANVLDRFLEERA